MPVIGRLDGQVEEVIINPVGRRPARRDGDEPATRPASQESGEAMRHELPEKRRDGRDEAGELPVWLL